MIINGSMKIPIPKTKKYNKEKEKENKEVRGFNP